MDSQDQTTASLSAVIRRINGATPESRDRSPGTPQRTNSKSPITRSREDDDVLPALTRAVSAASRQELEETVIRLVLANRRPSGRVRSPTTASPRGKSSQVSFVEGAGGLSSKSRAEAVVPDEGISTLLDFPHERMSPPSVAIDTADQDAGMRRGSSRTQPNYVNVNGESLAQPLSRAYTFMSSVAETTGVYSINGSLTEQVVAAIRIVVDQRDQSGGPAVNWVLRVDYATSAVLRSQITPSGARTHVWTCSLQSRGLSFNGPRAAGMTVLPAAADSITSDNLSCVAFDEDMDPPRPAVAHFVPRSWVSLSTKQEAVAMIKVSGCPNLATSECAVDLRQLDAVALVTATRDEEIAGWIDGLGRCSTVLESAVVVRLARQLATALTYLHQIHVIHGDVRPENILMPRGMCLSLENDVSVSRLIFAGWQDPICRGNSRVAADSEKNAAAIYFIAPEVLKGRAPTPAADGWSLGVTLYTLLFGVVPFVGNTPAEVIHSITEDPLRFPPEALSGKLRRWRGVLSALLDRNVEDRLCPADLLGPALEGLDGTPSKSSYGQTGSLLAP